MVHHDNFQNVLTSLKQFSAARLENPIPDVTLCRTPCSSPSQSLGQTPGTSTELHERNRHLESDASVFLDQILDQTPRKPTNWTECKQNPDSSEPGKEDTQNLVDTKGTHEDRRETMDRPGWQKALKKPLFCSQENLGKKQDSFVVEETVESKAVGDTGTYHGVEKGNGDVGTPPDAGKNTVLSTDVKVVMETNETPESPLLFVTPPTSFGGSDDVIETNQRMEVDSGNMRTGDNKDNERQDEAIEKKVSDIVVETERKGQVDVVKNVNPKEEVSGGMNSMRGWRGVIGNFVVVLSLGFQTNSKLVLCFFFSGCFVEFKLLKLWCDIFIGQVIYSYS